jgi:hypothetical protein
MNKEIKISCDICKIEYKIKQSETCNCGKYICLKCAENLKDSNDLLCDNCINILSESELL